MSSSYRRRLEDLRATEEARAISAGHALTLSIGYAHATRHDWRACSCPQCTACREVQGVRLVRRQLQLSGVR